MCMLHLATSLNSSLNDEGLLPLLTRLDPIAEAADLVRAPFPAGHLHDLSVGGVNHGRDDRALERLQRKRVRRAGADQQAVPVERRLESRGPSPRVCRPDVSALLVRTSRASPTSRGPVMGPSENVGGRRGGRELEPARPGEQDSQRGEVLVCEDPEGSIAKKLGSYLRQAAWDAEACKLGEQQPPPRAVTSWRAWPWRAHWRVSSARSLTRSERGRTRRVPMRTRGSRWSTASPAHGAYHPFELKKEVLALTANEVPFEEPRTVSFSPDASYILVGGTGGLGRPMSTWMVEHGTADLTFLSRHAGTDENSLVLFKEPRPWDAACMLYRGAWIVPWT